ncbi:MAG TPA: CocE/NonD family hydrolase [Thermoleophilaceae bacterium]|nr:CocE/NonD family hydrolase [Thermoleophilaceae bacterium]
MLRRGRLVLGAVALVLIAAPPSAGAAVNAHGSVEQVYVTKLEPKTKTTLVDRKGDKVARKRADKLGAVLFRKVKPGKGYRVKADGEKSPKLRVLTTRSAPPDTDVYDQEIPASGYGYMTTRDGTKLAYYVHPPQDITGALPIGYLPEGPSYPTPTLIEYSGYGYANPAGPQSGISILANLMGFTVVDINMRGTGCSGGAFDFFETLQSLDGYDIVETVARQPWVLHGRVGMMGISYGGISQLFTAQTQPPSLAAISPVSVIDQTQTTLYPGGVLNTGFAVNWALERMHEAKPAGPEAGQGWAWQRIQEGDKVCEENQELHGQAANLLAKIRANSHYRPKVADPLSPVTFVDKINVPVFMACQWQDEQTGGHCPTLPSKFTGTDRKWFTFTNGTHVDSLAPETFNRWYDFLKLYVEREAPGTDAAAYRAAAPVIYQAAMGIDGVMMPPDPIQEEPTYEGALEAFEAQEPIRVLFENGAGTEPGHPLPRFEHSFEAIPVPDTTARSWFLGGDGTLTDDKAEDAGVDSFRWDADARPLTNFTGSTSTGDNGLWTATPQYEWKQPPAASALSYVSAPLEEDTTVVGAGFLRAWLRSSKPRVDLQVTITEVRPDGKETFVQGGWLRGDMRRLDRRKSGPLTPQLSLRKKHIAPLPRKRFVKATIPLYYQGHAYRAGSQIRVLISAPNGDQPVWSFGETRPKGKADVAVAYSSKRSSRLTLPVVPGVEVPAGLPPCPSLRAQPCRDYESLANEPAG